MRKIYLMLLLCFAYLAGSSQTTVSIGTGTGTSTYFPIYYLFDYSYSQTIYSAAELTSGGATSSGMISKIRYKPTASASTVGKWKNWTVFMGNTSQNGYTATSNYIPSSTLTQVFLGDLPDNVTANTWVELTLSTPFLWDGSSNLVITVLDNTLGWGNTPTWAGYTATPISGTLNRGVYFYQDNTTINPNAPSATNSGVTNSIAQIQLEWAPASACSGMPSAGTAEAPVTIQCPNTSFNLSLSGTTSASGLDFQWQSRPTSGGAWTDISGATTKNYTLASGVPVNTDFRAYVTCTNGGLTDTSTITSVTVSTLAPGGTYTINSAMPTGSGNFQNFADAADYIKCGIGGPVVFDVAVGSGPYTEQVIFTSVYGTSATNTVTINGNGETLTFSAGTATNPNTLSLNGADYFRINYLNIEATGATYAIAAHLYNAADNNKFSNCTFTSSITGTATTQAAFVISGAAGTVATAGLSGSGNIVDSCTMVGGYYSTVVYGSTAAPFVENNQILNSSAKDFYSYGIYNVYGRNTIIRHNIVERVNRTNPTTAYGIYLSTSSYNCTVDGNRVRKLFEGNTASTSAAYCLYNAGSGAAGFENKWINNLVSDINSKGTIYGMYCPTYNFVKIYHNTISLDDATATGALATNGIYAYGNPVDIKNNIVTISRGGTGTKYCLYLSTSTTTTSNNNVLFMNASAGTANYTAYRTSAYTTLAAWQTATSLDMQSVSIDPLYSNPGNDDYLFTESSIDNMGASVGVLKDITGVNRSTTTPDPGAYELPPSVGLDMRPEALVTPEVSVGSCYNTETITVRIKNNSIDPINFATNPVTVTVNVTGAATATYSTVINTGTLLSDSSMNVTMVSPSSTLDMSVAGNYNFEITTLVTGDVNPANNTISASRDKIALTGGTAEVSQAALCASSVTPPTLHGTNVEGYNSLQWQQSLTSGTGFSNIGGATTITYTLASVPTSAMYYRLVATCSTTTSNSSEVGVTVDNPQITGTTPGSRCGPGTVNLSATTSSIDVNWYANLTGGAPLYTGGTFTTPSINSTKTYYVAASGGGVSNTTIPGDGAWDHFTTTGGFQTSAITSAYMILTVLQPLTLSSMDIYPSATIGTAFSIEARTGSVSTTPAFLSYSGTTTVQNTGTPTVAQTVNVNWVLPPGTYYIGFTSNPNTWRSGTATHTFPWVAPGLASMDFYLTPSYQYYFYNLKLSTACEGLRTPVVATVNTPPSIQATASLDTICNGQSSILNVTSSNTGYTYTWEPGTLVGPSQTVTPSQKTIYVVAAEDNSGLSFQGCTNTDTVTVVVNPTPTAVSINNTPATICPTLGQVATLAASGGEISGEFSFGTAASQNTATTYPAPYSVYYGGQRMQVLITAAELSAQGMQAGNIGSINFPVVSLGANWGSTTTSCQDFQVSIGATALTSLTSFQTGLTQVIAPYDYTPVVGYSNEQIFSTPFYWDGTSNLIIETTFSNNKLGATADGVIQPNSPTGYQSTIVYRVDNQTSSFVATGTTVSVSSSSRVDFKLNCSVPTTFAWSPLTGLFTDAGASIPYTGTSVTTVYAKPASTTTYTSTSTSSHNCSATQTTTVTVDCTVPVTYTMFTGKKEGSVNLLSWQTATEINNTGFELQRSADNKNFSKLDFIASKANNGNSNATLSYNYTDAKPLASSNYYRLKQIDRDGKANYSNTILLKGDNVKQVSIVGAYPNPARNILNVQIVAPAQERVSLVVTDITGKILQQETMVLNTGDNIKQIDVSRLTQGTYIIKTICSNGCESAVFKFTKN